MSASNPSTGRKRLDSWKEIAAFFGRDERTVNRWEKELGLPIHRLPGTKGHVYAYTDEVSAWLAAPKNADAASPGHDSAGQPGLGQPGLGASGLTVIAGRHVSVDAESLESPSGEEVRTASARRYRNTIGLAAAAILGMGAMALVLFHASASRSSKTAGQAASQPRQTSPGGVVRASTPSHDPDAEQLYLKGRYYWEKRTPDDLNKSLDFFMQAIVHDPNYSQAYVGMADCYNLMREYTLMPSSEAYPRALAAAKKAVELDDQSSEAHASLAFVTFFGMWDVPIGEQEFRRAIDLNPNNPAAHHWYANGLLALHRLPEALAEIDRAQALDPASSAILADKGNILWVAGRQDEALSLLKHMESRDPSFRSPHLYLKYVYFRNQDYPNFLSEFRKDALVVHDDSALAIATAAEKGFAAGGAQGMLEAMLRVQKKLYAQHSVPPTDLAWTLALLGKKNEALRYLKAAYEQRDGSLLFVEVYPEFNNLHDEPAYRDLLARMNLPVENAP
jgi:tetratricopeptide (TPR) repeat protein